MTPTYRRDVLSVWPGLIAELDREFVTGRGRTISLSTRYPHVFGPASSAQVHVVAHGDDLLACAVSLPFTWRTDDGEWRCAATGFVYTTPAARGHGHGRTLLQGVLAALREDAVDVAVLWSGLAGYYTRQGWTRGDCGVYGHARGAPGRVPAGAPPDDAALVRARAMRGSVECARADAAWLACPLPAEHLRIAETANGYALFGVVGSRHYLYEMVASGSEYPALWAQVVAGADEVHVNLATTDPARNWLDRHATITWQPQALTHWYPLTDAGARQPLSTWYIPWLDRL